MTLIRKRVLLGAALALLATSAMALPVVRGVMEGQKLSGGRGPMGQMAVGDFQIQHIDEFKGAKRVAISVFNVAFPSENALTANTKAKGGNMVYTAQSSLHTSLTGVDRATQQRVADTAYAAFVEELTKAGYEVVGPEELARLTPEFTTWASLPNFTQGRFGTYVAPTGRVLRLLPNDGAKRDTSGQLGQLGLGFRGLDRPQAFTRSPYLAYDGKIGVIAVTLVVDYGLYSSSGEGKSARKATETGFIPAVTVQSGVLFDTATIVDFWGPKSGGFPGTIALAAPVADDEPFGRLDDRGGGYYTVAADPAKFEAVADSVTKQAVAKLVGAMAAAR
jgi:hypothetical protein